MTLSQSILSIDGAPFSYWENFPKKTDRVIVLLAPGPYLGNYFAPYASLIGASTKVIAPDYPGRGQSKPIADNSVGSVAEHVLTLLRELPIDGALLVGHSYGGAVANEIIARESEMFQEVVLIATGEFFTPTQKILLKALFYPATHSSFIRKSYRTLVNRYVFPAPIVDVDLTSLLSQWIGILEYQIPTEAVMGDVHAVLIVFDQKQTVHAASLKKLQRLYPHNTVRILDRGRHSPRSHIADSDHRELAGYINAVSIKR